MKEFETLREQIRQQDGDRFPSRAFAALVLRPAYDQAKKNMLGAMMEVNRAHLIMLHEQGLLTQQEAESIGKGLNEIDTEALEHGEYTGQYEDLFFEVEGKLLELCGDPAGSLHLARSRNDMGVTMYRMVLRRRLTGVMEALNGFIAKLAVLAREHERTVMVAITHTQQAQISTLGHYLLGACQLLDRDFGRLSHAYATVNQSAMGACAITTTGFPIDRARMAELLGFDGYILNSYDAIGGGDYLGEAAAALQLCAIDAGRIVQDLMLWAGQEYNGIRAADPYVQISSIMPQKRNPVSIEHLRSMLSAVGGQCTTLLNMLHNTPYGDIVDTEDDAQPFLWSACDTLEKCYVLWGNIMGTLSVNKEVLLERAQNGFAAVTELADTLVREEGIPFRTAHGVASKVARTLSAQKRVLADLTAEEMRQIYADVTGKILHTEFEAVMECLQPEHFISVRNVPGGCGPRAMEGMFRAEDERREVREYWLQERRKTEEQARDMQDRGLRAVIQNSRG